MKGTRQEVGGGGGDDDDERFGREQAMVSGGEVGDREGVADNYRRRSDSGVVVGGHLAARSLFSAREKELPPLTPCFRVYLDG